MVLGGVFWGKEKILRKRPLLRSLREDFTLPNRKHSMQIFNEFFIK